MNNININELRYQPPLDICEENLEKYCPGGYCPIDIGDEIANSRFKIVHKLGHGGFATVWLGHDRENRRYVAIKIVTADHSDNYEPLLDMKCLIREHPHNFLSEIERFTIESYNGHHLCQVFPVLGPTLFDFTTHRYRLFPAAVRRFAHQAMTTLAMMHSRGLCHGDLTLRNIAVRLTKQFENLTEDELYNLIGSPNKEQIKLESRARTKPAQRHKDLTSQRMAPKNVVGSADLKRLPRTYLSDTICILDFGQAYLAKNAPRALTGIRPSYTAPEVIFELRNGPGADIWAIACGIFRMRCGEELFTDFNETPSNTVYQIYTLLGPLPDQWRKVVFRNGWPVHENLEGKEPGHFSRDIPIDRMGLWNLVKETVDRKPGGGALHWCVPQSERGDSPAPGTGPATNGSVPITMEEAECFYDLLLRMLVYNPDKRISATSLLKHPWFKRGVNAGSRHVGLSVDTCAGVEVVHDLTSGSILGQ